MLGVTYKSISIFNPRHSDMNTSPAALVLISVLATSSEPQNLTTSVEMPDNETVVIMKIHMKENGNKTNEENLKERIVCKGK